MTFSLQWNNWRDPEQEDVVAVLYALAHRLEQIKQIGFGLTRLLYRGDSAELGYGTHSSEVPEGVSVRPNR